MNRYLIKNILVCILLILCLGVLCACGKKDKEVEDPVDILLITDIGTVTDGSYNQGTWAGLSAYAAEHGLIAKYYEPKDTSLDSYLEQISTGVKNGAQVIVCPGYLLEEVVYVAQKKYDDVDFILIDGVPHDEDYEDRTIAKNTECILFEEEEAGFLAGYAVVRDGYTNLGFIGGVPEDPVIRFGYGFVQGADYASIQLGLPVHVKYCYANTYYEDDSVKNMAGQWYDEGCEVIFACGGAMGRSVMRAAEEHYGKVVGVDVDQSYESETVITSAMKSLEKAVYMGLEDHYNGTFRGGEIVKLSAKESAVCLPWDTAKFNKFDFEEYQKLYLQLVDGLIDPYADTSIGTCEELTLINTDVTYIIP